MEEISLGKVFYRYGCSYSSSVLFAGSRCRHLHGPVCGGSVKVGPLDDLPLNMRHGAMVKGIESMSESAAAKAYRHYTIWPALVAVFFLLSPVITTAIPRVTWLFLPLIGFVTILAAARKNGVSRRLIEVNVTLTACLLVAAYVFLSATWAADPGTALGKGALLTGVLLISFATSRAIPQLDQHQLRIAAIALSIGTFVAALFVTFELLTDGAITRLILNSVALLQRPNPKHGTINNGEITYLNLSRAFNQNVTILVFNLWPALLALKSVIRSRGSIFSGVLFAAVALAVFLSEQQSSQVALVVSFVVFCLSWLWRGVIRSLAALWCLAFALVLPIDFLAYDANLHMAQWLPNSFRARVIIWEYTAERFFDHPWLGVGADSTRAMKEQRRSEKTAEQPPGFIYPRTIGSHAHNIFLQTLFELGVIGAILMAFAGAAVALRMSLLRIEAQPFAAASFTAFMAIASFAWGMWQTWLICGAAILLIYLLVGGNVAAGESRVDVKTANDRGDLASHPEVGREPAKTERLP
jgi:O-antigen ligase